MFWRRASHILDMLPPCRSHVHISSTHICHFLFWTVSPTWREAQLVPLSTSRLLSCMSPPRSTALTLTNYSTLTQHARERQRGGKGAGPGRLGVREADVLVRQVCTALLGRRKEGGKRGKGKGTTKRMRANRSCGRCESCTDEAAVRGGEVSVRIRWKTRVCWCVCSTNGAAGVSGLCWQLRVDMDKHSEVADSFARWYRWSRCACVVVRLMSRWVMGRKKWGSSVQRVHFFGCVCEIVSVKTWMRDHVWGCVNWGTAYLCINSMCERVNTCSATSVGDQQCHLYQGAALYLGQPVILIIDIQQSYLILLSFFKCGSNFWFCVNFNANLTKYFIRSFIWKIQGFLIA